jgi:hypothetical protein
MSIIKKNVNKMLKLIYKIYINNYRENLIMNFYFILFLLK